MSWKEQPPVPPEPLMAALTNLLRAGLSNVSFEQTSADTVNLALPDGRARICWQGAARKVAWLIHWPAGDVSPHASTVAVLTALRGHTQTGYSAGRAVIGHRPRAAEAEADNRAGSS